MTHTKINRIVALGVFAVAFGVYLLTLSPTVVFWDVGEFIAAAKLMQVPHPPGSPLFLYVARIAMMIPFAADQAVRAHAFSAMCSALGIMFTYLVIIRLLIDFKGVPQKMLDRVTMYGAGVIGALSLAFNTTYWDNSIEAEVYGASMLFLTAIMWLVMRWQERSEWEGSEKYIILIAYLIGLSLGVHLLALLAIFPVLMVVYFKKYEYTFSGFVKFGIVAALAFFVVYPGVVKILPGLMDGEFRGEKSDIIAIIPWAIIAVIAFFVYDSYTRKRKILHLSLLSILLIFLGYTTYVGVLIRSNANPPMNENDPSNLARLTSYLGREQYGDSPLFFPRRWSQEPHQQRIYTEYSSDTDYMLRYQLGHMFFRYIGWNYVGQEGDAQDSGIAWGQTLGIPLFLGLFGLYYQWKRDWKMALVFIAMFIILGPILALYQNQQEPQPRERDYFYVGAMYVISIWIAIGLMGLIDYIKQWLTNENSAAMASYAAIAIFAVAIPGNMLRMNWTDHDRSGNFVAWDYSYNILQTCEKDAILFTNGDNDTFPLWYLQDVEGVRRDVRIVNLSLVNTPWYIQQMKRTPYYAEAKAVPISYTAAEIDRIQPVQWQTQTRTLPVTMDAIERYGVTDSSIIKARAITYTFRPTLDLGQIKAIRVQDIMVNDIITTNQWKRPIYFAVTVSPDSKIGFDDYLWFHGLAWRLEPRRVTDQDRSLDAKILEANLFNEPQGFSKEAQYGYKWRNVANPKVYFDENTSRLMVNYRAAFIRLALYHINVTRDTSKARAALDRMETLIPRSKIDMGWELTSDIASFYRRLGDEKKYNELTGEIEPICLDLIAKGQVNMNSPYNPYRVLLEIYDVKKEYRKSIDLLTGLQGMYPNDPGLKQRIAELQALSAQASKPDTTIKTPGAK
jgi:hypothetical protein